ncbi:MAG: hypothetical protein BAJATHORv1_40218 [Candidatus Thorarchaeota archaeon]|nr:MAG: hypothetical protein BAJATHORv1_40218 [Candidatus Thorarchaeota archaeon]
MKVNKVGDRGLLFSFEDPYFTNSYVIEGERRIYVLDTQCGPNLMLALIKHLEKMGISDKDFVIFNSHEDYDHIWGNCAFSNSIIISHSICRDIIISEGEKNLDKYAEFKRGDVILVPPNLVFDSRLNFSDDGIDFFFTPGHQLGCASVYDRKDRVLFVGDNVENPFPYINEPNFDEYIKTLERYTKMDWKYVITGHNPIITGTKLIEKNIDYLKRIKDWIVDFDSLSKSERSVHITNLTNLTDKMRWNSLSTQAKETYQEAISYLQHLEKNPVILEKLDKLIRFQS